MQINRDILQKLTGGLGKEDQKVKQALLDHWQKELVSKPLFKAAKGEFGVLNHWLQDAQDPVAFLLAGSRQTHHLSHWAYQVACENSHDVCAIPLKPCKTQARHRELMQKQLMFLLAESLPINNTYQSYEALMATSREIMLNNFQQNGQPQKLSKFQKSQIKHKALGFLTSQIGDILGKTPLHKPLLVVLDTVDHSTHLMIPEKMPANLKMIFAQYYSTAPDAAERLKTPCTILNFRSK